MKAGHACLSVLIALASADAVSANELYARAGWVANIPPGAHSVQAVATIIDDRTIHVENFTYDGGGPAVYFYLGATNTNQDFLNGLRVPPLLTGTVYSDDSLTLTLPPGETLDGYGALSVWCEVVKVNFSSASFQPPASTPTRLGWVADMPPGGHDSQGQATIITDRLLFLENFSYDGAAIAVYFYLGQANDYASFFTGLEVPPLLGAYNNESLVVTLPDGASIGGYGAISVWCAAVNVSFTSATFRPPVPGDADNDGVTGLADHAIFVDCAAGPSRVPDPSGATVVQCLGAFDTEDDVDVDLFDAAQFAPTP